MSMATVVESVSPATERRIRHVWITPEFLFELLRINSHGGPLCALRISGLPMDAELHGAHWSELRQMFVLRASHESFDPVPHGEIVPDLDIKMETIQVIPRTEAGLPE